MSLIEKIDRKPPAGLSLREQIRMGSLTARARVRELITQRSPSGFSPREWRAMGLSCSRTEIRQAVKILE
jgi:hypothetical protein